MTTEQDNGSGKVTYTVRELLAELKVMVTNIDTKLDAKAEKSVVENLLARIATIETERRAEREYGQILMNGYQELLKEHTQVKLDINSLQTNKKDKDTFNILWIPVIFNTVVTVAVGIVGAFLYINR